MRKKQKVINLFNDKEISSIKHVISIGSEEDLNQLWDFSTNSNSASYENIHTFIAKFYNFAINYIRLNDDFFDIIIEESNDYFYFTLWNKRVSLNFEKLLKKSLSEYLRKWNRITIKLDKSKCFKDIQKKESGEYNKELLSSKPQIQKIYTFLTYDDLSELVDLNNNMQDIIYNIKESSFDKKSFVSLRSTISLFSFTLRYYEEVSLMATLITSFSNLMNTNEKKFTDLNRLEYKLISGFIQNIDNWMQALFIKGGANIDFMNSSMKADYRTIEDIIEPKNLTLSKSNSLDDIFNF